MLRHTKAVLHSNYITRLKSPQRIHQYGLGFIPKQNQRMNLKIEPTKLIPKNCLMSSVSTTLLTKKEFTRHWLPVMESEQAQPFAEKRKATNIQRQNLRQNKRPKRSDGPKEAFEEIEEKNNPCIVKSILVYTKSKRGNKFQWLPAKVELKNNDDNEMMKYSDGIINRYS